MKSKILRWIIGLVGLIFLLSAAVITLIEWNQFRAQTLRFPEGSTIADLPVGGLDEAKAVERIANFYDLPLQLEIENTIIQVDPQVLGLSINPANMVSEGINQIEPRRFWEALWRSYDPQPVSISLDASVDENQLLGYLNREIVPRYTQAGSVITPVPGTTNFNKNECGVKLDKDAALADITQALIDPGRHHVSLHTITISEDNASMEMLGAFLRHNIDHMGFGELVEIYLQSMETGQSLHFAVQSGREVVPDVAFTAGSTIKIPIMISVLRRTDEPTPQSVVDLLERMIVLSENPPADTLMSTYIDPVRGPLLVSEDLEALGLENTFLAGFFALGSPVLKIFTTTANSREDIFLDPDIYNQTVPSEAGQILTAIYQCAADGDGLLVETFPGEITQSECQLMIDILSANRIGLLIEAGLPPEAVVAHKHGWVQELDGLLHSMSDVAILFTPGGDYVLTIFIYDPERLDFDAGNRLIARLSQTVYNFFNIENQAYWWFD
jgi:hypothetical protein